MTVCNNIGQDNWSYILGWINNKKHAKRASKMQQQEKKAAT